MFEPRPCWPPLPEALRKLDPRTMWRNPVMFVVLGRRRRSPRSLAVAEPSVFAWWITVWLWLTVVFANLAEAVAEGRGKAQAAALRATRTRHHGPPARCPTAPRSAVAGHRAAAR